MRKHYLITGLLILTALHCKKESLQNPIKENSREKHIEALEPKEDTVGGIKFLHEFYEKVYCENNIPNDSFMNLYLSKSFKERLEIISTPKDNEEVGELDYDPFLKAQDYDCPSLLNSLKIHYMPKKRTYLVVYQSWEDKPISIEYYLKIDENRFRQIDNIVNDSLLNSFR